PYTFGVDALPNSKVVKFTQELLLDQEPGAISPGLISEKIDEVLAFKPAWREGLDRDAAITELVRRFSVWISADTSISSLEGHKAWLEADRKGDWRYWQRYREFVEGKMSDAAVEALDRSTDNI